MQAFLKMRCWMSWMLCCLPVRYACSAFWNIEASSAYAAQLSLLQGSLGS